PGGYAGARVGPGAGSERVTGNTCAGTARTSSHEPRLLTRSPAHIRRKSRTRSAWNMTASLLVSYSDRIVLSIDCLSRQEAGMASDLAIGRQLRARRTAAGRTVASVAADAGLSVPYSANLENGRGNPTTAALSRLAGALGLRLEITLGAGEEAGPGAAPGPGPAPMPGSLVRLGRTRRFRETTR